MLQLRLSVPTELTEAALDLLDDDPAVSALSVVRGASLKPVGDIITADLAREGAHEIVVAMRDLGIHECGTIALTPLDTWVSKAGYEAERATPGSSADSVVWAEVTQRSYEDTELNWTFLSFMVLATLLATIAIIVDSQILTIGAMVLGPEFGAIAALGLSLVRKRWDLWRLATRSLLVGFGAAIAVTTLASLVADALGWIPDDQVTGGSTATAFIYHPDKWSFIVALIAAAAGVLSLTSSKVGGLSGVFISVTTIPAAGNIALGIALRAWDQVWGSSVQLVLNIAGMAVAGWLTLLIQQTVWTRVSAARARRLARRSASRSASRHPRQGHNPHAGQ